MGPLKNCRCLKRFSPFKKIQDCSVNIENILKTLAAFWMSLTIKQVPELCTHHCDAFMAEGATSQLVNRTGKNMHWHLFTLFYLCNDLLYLSLNSGCLSSLWMNWWIQTTLITEWLTAHVTGVWTLTTMYLLMNLQITPMNKLLMTHKRNTISTTYVNTSSDQSY
jgi:hypothetical protein